ncbi:4Fe-4S binding protein [Alisedimentitalea sp. MJ-SS2]|uniref:4Fe-4S binding protein n=1 Tax=Aliisedimentitalea sp. MJ-SS2 TaxID=3049795 RepID=UPI00290E3A76|nr:4Fe-4S binding protein [Alisedimentitalea sp. MJ-SS2]MDU8929355.1 4Fe-4S binding protein [Alisedimentitalea sp. MJ-SS2]
MALDSKALEKATGIACSTCHSNLCGTQAEIAATAIAKGEATICCTQEQAFFEALADEIQAPLPGFLDLRDRAAWSTDKRSKLPKMAALVADAAILPAPEKMLDVISEGQCLILGGDLATEAAEQLHPHLAVTVLLDPDSELPLTRSYDVIRGQLRNATGALAGFSVVIDQLQSLEPGGHGAWQMSSPRDGGRSQCDIILDLSGRDPLFPAPEKREGYLRADPGDPKAVARVVLQASHLVGTFEKPLYVKSEPVLCAHSRATQTGCTRCLDACPTGAITPSGDHVSVDPMICAGCGACAVLCPSGAITYDAPTTDHTIRRIQVLAQAYRDAGGSAPRLLVVDAHGTEMIGLSARFDAGLPADVIPLELSSLNSFGHAEALAALAAGFADVFILLAPKTDREVMEQEAGLTRAIGGLKLHLLDISDPAALTESLMDHAVPMPCDTPVRPMGTRRQITRTAALALNPEGTVLSLPDGAPYGAVLVDSDACTLCLSCVSLCPSGALGDNPDHPQLRFQEDACLQCGLCANVCPERAISYEPRLNLAPSALEQAVLHEEEPFACVECGALFGVKSTIEKITEKLAGKHAMFATSDAARMIQMCDNCRVNAQYHAENNPFTEGERPRVRTTEDYLSKRRDH